MKPPRWSETHRCPECHSKPIIKTVPLIGVLIGCSYNDCELAPMEIHDDIKAACHSWNEKIWKVEGRPWG